jgi:hypothetical protein
MNKEKPSPTIYLAQVEGRLLATRREALRVKLELHKQMPHDKKDYKRQRDAIIKEMNALTFDMEGKMAEVYKQNYQVVKYMLMMFAGMDFITRLYDEAADLFKAVTVGIKRDELLDFVKMCREVANKANEVVCIIDGAGNEAMSMAYAEMEDGIGERLLNELRQHVDDYGKSPAGRKYFYGDHLK